MNKLYKLIIFTVFMTLIVGCSSSKSYDMTTENSTPPVFDGISKVSLGSGEGYGLPQPDTESKIITTVHLGIETKEYDKSISTLNEIIESTGSYIEQLNESNNGYSSETQRRTADITIRVPKDKLEIFNEKSGSIGQVTNKSISSDDVSEYYYDTESRLNVINTKEGRILALLEKADKMEDIIQLENNLSEIIYEKEQLTGALRGIDNKVEYSSVSINLSEVSRVTTTQTVKESFTSRVGRAFSDSMYEFKSTLEELVIAVIYSLPFLVVMSITVYIGVRLFNKHSKNRIDKK